MNYQELQNRLNWTLPKKIEESKKRIVEWYEAWEGRVYGAFSGGLDSTVMMNLIWEIFPEVKAVHINTGLEYPEIGTFVKKTSRSRPVIILHPKVPFHKIIEKYGYPVISKEISKKLWTLRSPTTENNKKVKRLYTEGISSKGKFYPRAKLPNKYLKLLNAPFKISHKCCYFLKKSPSIQYEKNSQEFPFIGIRIEESQLRTSQYIRKGGCNAFDLKRPISWPISFWTKQNILDYIKLSNLEYAKIYDFPNITSTGCMFCLFGVGLEQQKRHTNRFIEMKTTHPKHWEYCIYKLKIGQILDYLNIPYGEGETQRKLF